VKFQRDCYVAGITAAAMFNSRRQDSTQPVLDAMDFCPRPAEEVQFEEIVSMLREQLGSLNPEQYAAARGTWLANLSAKGLPAEEILMEVFEGIE
jgi:hypothetical protein